MLGFRKMLDGLPFNTLPEMKPDAVCLVDDMEVASAACLLARQAGINLKFQAARAALTDAAVYFLPSMADRGGISLEDWHKLFGKVEAGAVCFLSADDSNQPDMRAFCGMQVARRRKALGAMECILDGETLTLKREWEKTIQAESAEVLLSDRNGNPLLLRNRYGKGTVYTLTFSLEKILTETSRGFDAPWWKIYRMVLNKNLLVRVSDPAVILTEHYFGKNRAAVVAVNCSDEAKEIAPEIAGGWKRESIHGDGIDIGGKYRLPPGGGMIFVMQRS